MYLFGTVMLECDFNVIVLPIKQQINSLYNPVSGEPPSIFGPNILLYSKSFQSMERVRKHQSSLRKEEMQIPQSIHGAGGSARVTDGWN